MQKIIPCLWFDDDAQEAIEFYRKVFKEKDNKLRDELYYDKASAEVSGQKEGSFLTGTFTIKGQEFMVLNGGPQFKFSEAISFVINCEDQDEVDYYWEALTSNGGEESMCGWLKDKFGVSWQVVPVKFNELATDPDKEKSQRVMKAMLKMKKLDLSELEKAYKGK